MSKYVVPIQRVVYFFRNVNNTFGEPCCSKKTRGVHMHSEIIAQLVCVQNQLCVFTDIICMTSVMHRIKVLL